MVKLERPTLKDQALVVIRQSVVTGEIEPGEILSAAALAARLGTSNGPVREAMLTLVEQDIVDVVPNRGFRVKRLSDHDLDEIHELRVMAEVPAVERLALEHSRRGNRRNVDLPAIRDLAVACQESAQIPDVTQFLESDREFHLNLIATLGNRRLVRHVALLRDQTRLYAMPQLAEESRLQTAALEHLRILEAITDGDSARAGALMRQHLAHVRRDWARPEPVDATIPRERPTDAGTHAVP